MKSFGSETPSNRPTYILWESQEKMKNKKNKNKKDIIQGSNGPKLPKCDERHEHKHSRTSLNSK